MTIHLLIHNWPISPLFTPFSHVCSSPDHLHPSRCPPLVLVLNTVFGDVLESSIFPKPCIISATTS